jgi:hypothetical protein
MKCKSKYQVVFQGKSRMTMSRHLLLFSVIPSTVKNLFVVTLLTGFPNFCDLLPGAEPPQGSDASGIVRFCFSLNPLARTRDLCNKKSSSKTFFQRCVGKGGELRMRKRIVLLSGTTLFALMLTFAGCGKKEESAPPPPPPPAPAPAAPAEPAAPSGEMKAPADQPSGGAPMEKKDEETKTK